ncbi:MAG: hypothetical protein KAS39_08025 [Actinomycetia bacterium]|nr:hypothetical protein [Actinomycetes bacterium]
MKKILLIILILGIISTVFADGRNVVDYLTTLLEKKTAYDSIMVVATSVFSKTYEGQVLNTIKIENNLLLFSTKYEKACYNLNYCYSVVFKKKVIYIYITS